MSVRATFYVQLAPEFTYYDPEKVRGAKAVAMTQSKPQKQRSGTVVIKLTVEIPEGAFAPLSPEAVVRIPESFALAAPIEVDVEDPA